MAAVVELGDTYLGVESGEAETHVSLEGESVSECKSVQIQKQLI